MGTKTTDLANASVPLAGTESLAIVQSGVSVEVSVIDLTADRPVDAESYTASGNGDLVNIRYVADGGTALLKWKNSAGTTLWTVGGGFVERQDELAFARGSTVVLYLDNSDNVRVRTGNLVVSTAGKGIDFSANTNAAGMTSEVLNWYEEGDWTPNQGVGLTVVGTFSSSGKYTRVGRLVTVSGIISATTSVAVAVSNVISSNLPFTVGSPGHGSVTNATTAAFAAIICNSTSVISAGSIAATAAIAFSATYTV